MRPCAVQREERAAEVFRGRVRRTKGDGIFRSPVLLPCVQIRMMSLLPLVTTTLRTHASSDAVVGSGLGFLRNLAAEPSNQVWGPICC